MKTNTHKITGMAMAMAAAGFFTAAPTIASAGDEAKVHCYGVNSCKGQNDCATAENACKGEGACKGHGFLVMTQSECEEAGGTVEE